jgi:hypothetical protein
MVPVRVIFDETGLAPDLEPVLAAHRGMDFARSQTATSALNAVMIAP